MFIPKNDGIFVIHIDDGTQIVQFYTEHGGDGLWISVDTQCLERGILSEFPLWFRLRQNVRSVR